MARDFDISPSRCAAALMVAGLSRPKCVVMRKKNIYIYIYVGFLNNKIAPRLATQTLTALLTNVYVSKDSHPLATLSRRNQISPPCTHTQE